VIKRHISDYLITVSKQFPIITLTGPRQSGKTTLVKNLFSNKQYVSLENPDEKEFAMQDPRGFFARFKNGAIIDEAQNVPHLFSYLQEIVDKSNKSGEYILTGSQNFLLLEQISQSLAGRTVITHLLPLSYSELLPTLTQSKYEVWDFIFSGFYPRIYDKHVNPTDWCKSYIATYVERDVRKITAINNLSKFQTFIRLCAGRIGQLLNISSLASDCGIDHATAKSWLSILEASFILFLLKPYHKNFNKRLVKQSKLYFYDTGLACYLLGIENSNALPQHFIKGNIFENFVISELIKSKFNKGKDNNLYFWRDNHGHEIDVIFEKNAHLIATEIKAGQTINTDFFKGLDYWKNLTGHNDQYLIYAGNSEYIRQGVQIINWENATDVFS
jgi:predicted AAA+ superfamily ATPase